MKAQEERIDAIRHISYVRKLMFEPRMYRESKLKCILRPCYSSGCQRQSGDGGEKKLLAHTRNRTPVVQAGCFTEQFAGMLL
jgi:hypothetical protein